MPEGRGLRKALCQAVFFPLRSARTVTGYRIILMTVAAKGCPVRDGHFAATTAPDAFMEFHSAERHRSAAMRAAPTIPLPHGSPDVIDGNGTQNERDTVDSN